VTPTFGLKLWS